MSRQRACQTFGQRDSLSVSKCYDTNSVTSGNVNLVYHMLTLLVVVVVVVTPSSLSRLLVILYQDFLGNF